MISACSQIGLRRIDWHERVIQSINIQSEIMLILNVKLKAWQQTYFLWRDFKKAVNFTAITRYAAILPRSYSLVYLRCPYL